MLNEMGTIDLTPIIKAVILLISVVITCVVVPWIRAHTSAEKQENLRALYRTLVFAAEQLYGAGNGPEKLNYVCARLREMGYEVNLSEVEAAVYEWLNFDTPLLRATAGERIAASAPEEETGERIATSAAPPRNDNGETDGERIATSAPEEPPRNDTTEDAPEEPESEAE